ncbi:hypothetical protein ABE85_02155 [Mitsuaria sp. 7]|nr:hypothetical protein ABE85_02155 [Mitsuaria sp. 7]
MLHGAIWEEKMGRKQPRQLLKDDGLAFLLALQVLALYSTLLVVMFGSQADAVLLWLWLICLMAPGAVVFGVGLLSFVLSRRRSASLRR